MQLTARQAAVTPVKGHPGESKIDVMPAKYYFKNLGTRVCIQYSAYSTVHTVQCIQYSAYSTVHTVVPVTFNSD